MSSKNTAVSQSQISLLGLAAALAMAGAGCLADAGDPGDPASAEPSNLGSVSQDIFHSPEFFQDVEQTYPEFVVVNSGGAGCSGVLLDSQVMLTAGHCWNGSASIQVTRDGIGQHYCDIMVTWSNSTADGEVDLLLCHLDRPIFVGVQPEIEPTLWVGDTATYTGRIDGGAFTNRGHGIRHRTISWIGSTKADSDWSVLQHGDSGGPAFLDWSHRLVGINSGIWGDNETPGSFDRISRLFPGVAYAIQQSARDFGGPGTNVLISPGR